MSDPTLIADLVRAGIDAELVGRVANAIASAASGGMSGGQNADAAAERRRAYDRERKRSKRNSTGHSTGIPPDTDSASSLSCSSELKEQSKSKKERKRGEKLPVEWQPSESHYREGAIRGFNKRDVEAMAEDMRLWARANEHRAVARKSDWDSTFRAWMRRQHADRRATGPPRNGGAKSFLDLELELSGHDHDDQPPDDRDLLDVTPAGPRS